MFTQPTFTSCWFNVFCGFTGVPRTAPSMSWASSPRCLLFGHISFHKVKDRRKILEIEHGNSMLLPRNDPSHFCHILLAKNPHDYKSVLRVWGNVVPLLHTCRGREPVLVLRYTYADPKVNYLWCHSIDELNVLRAGYMFTKQQCWAWPRQPLCGTHHLTTMLCYGVPLHWEPIW